MYTAIKINPYAPYIRTGSSTGVGCTYNAPNIFTVTLLHEARHTYQESLGMSNDNDQNILIAVMPSGVPDASTIIDSATPRTVCNPLGSPMLVQGAFQGDSVKDPFQPQNPAQPGTTYYASWALEFDAYAWVASVLGQ